LAGIGHGQNDHLVFHFPAHYSFAVELQLSKLFSAASHRDLCVIFCGSVSALSCCYCETSKIELMSTLLASVNFAGEAVHPRSQGHAYQFLQTLARSRTQIEGMPKALTSGSYNTFFVVPDHDAEVMKIIFQSCPGLKASRANLNSPVKSSTVCEMNLAVL